MRLTIALEGNGKGRLLSSIDMEEIVKMTITDDIEKSNFNPQMLKSCQDTAYDCGYQQGRADREKELSELPNEYSERLWKNAYYKGRADAIEEFANIVLTELEYGVGGSIENFIREYVEEQKLKRERDSSRDMGGLGYESTIWNYGKQEV